MHASNIMTHKLITLTPDATVHEAAATLRKHKLHDLPVIDANGVPIGIVTARAILHAALPDYVSEELLSPMRGGPDIPSIYQHLKGISEHPVSEVMDLKFMMVRGDDPTISIAAQLVFLQSDSHNILVIDSEGKLTGTISALDIVNRMPE